MSSSRINARLPPDVARKVTYLERVTQQSTTLVVRESIERFYAAVTREGGSPAALLEEAGFIGCAAGPADLSTTYKAELTTSLRDKT